MPELVQFSVIRLSVSVMSVYLVVEPTSRISLASFSNLQRNACDQSCCLSGIVFIAFLT